MSDGLATTEFETRRADWLTVEEAHARIRAAAAPLQTDRVPVASSLGMALAEPIRSTANLPPWDNSAMDGYAVRADDVADVTDDRPVRLEVVGAVRAGEPSDAVVAPGQAARIMTGGPVPKGATTIIRVEDTDAEIEAGVVEVRVGAAPGRHIRAAGQDMKAGDTLLEPGHAITPGTIGVLAAAGLGKVEVVRRPVVGIITTGDELRTVDRFEDVREGRGVPDSNAPMLAAMVSAAGGDPRVLGIARDDREEIRARLEAGRGCDAIVTVGGASMGEADLVKGVLDDMGFELDFWRVKMRPGSPLSFGFLPNDADGAPVFGLPGNPGSAFVTFEVFVRPFLRALAGHARTRRRVISAVSQDVMDVPAPLVYFQRVKLGRSGDGATVTLTGLQGSGLVGGLSRADGLAIIPPEVERVEPGETVNVLLLHDELGQEADA